jgi:hypothetical protein
VLLVELLGGQLKKIASHLVSCHCQNRCVEDTRNKDLEVTVVSRFTLVTSPDHGPDRAPSKKDRISYGQER